MRIGNRQIGIDHPPYVIAEIGVNHDGEVERALSLTDAAADAGADAVKLQFFETDRLMSRAAKLAAYQKNAGETDPIEMLRRLELTIDEMARVVDRAHERGIHAIVTVFSTELVEIAETLAWDAYKTASPDIVNKPLLEALAKTGKPMIVSTGASTLDEVVRAVGWLDDVRDRLAVLQCVSSYPAPDPAFGGIRAIAEATGVLTGYSDHTSANNSVGLITSLGVRLFEKHLTYNTAATGPDHLASLNPMDFREYVRTTIGSYSHDAYQGAMVNTRYRKAWEDMEPVLGPIEKRVLDCERDVREVSRQSVVTTRDIAPGETITREMVTIKRPGTGILAYRLDEVVGSVAKRAIESDVPIVEEDLA
jgi:sialic acid synthase SpsE